MIIYRLEDETTGGGPYTSGSIPTSWLMKHNDMAHPTPQQDPKLYAYFEAGTDECYFGFSSLIQLHKWFDSHLLTRMHKLGTKIVRYKVLDAHCVVSDYQAIFLKEHATKLGNGREAHTIT